MSLFHHMNGFKCFEYQGSWDEFFELFLKGIVETNSWFEHVRPWWEHRNDGNILFLKYEDMKADPAANVRKIAAFIGVDDLTEEQVGMVVSQSSFDSMRASSTANMTWTHAGRYATAQPFLRKGVVGMCSCLC